jgi:hypothetical protein
VAVPKRHLLNQLILENKKMQENKLLREDEQKVLFSTLIDF